MGLFGIPRFIGFVGILAVPVSSQTLIPGAGCNKPVQKGFDLQQVGNYSKHLKNSSYYPGFRFI
jgi:hypothetical protein